MIKMHSIFEYMINHTPVRRRQLLEETQIRQFFNGLSPEKKTVLLAGPFVGEFGWEVAQWQGYVRFLSRFYEKTIIVSRPENAYLYQDISPHFISHDPGGYDTEFYYCANQMPFETSSFDLADHLDPKVVGKFLSNYLTQEYFIYGKTVAQIEGFDVVIHGRNIPAEGGLVSKSYRNWPREYWKDLCDLLLTEKLRVAAIGIPTLSVCLPGVTDLRSYSLEMQCQVLYRSRVCVGPSSGAMHLASHSNCPVIIWSDRHGGTQFGGTANRYLFSWNPHRSDAIAIIDDAWAPEPQFVFRQIMDMIEVKATGQRVHRIIESR